MEVYRNTCPRNCYGTCSILSYVSDNHLIKVTGDPKHGFTQGHLCAKGYAYTQYVYNPLRLKYPILQTPRGSGNWLKITWEEAYSIIAEKILELYSRYGSNLSCGYNKFSGNLGLLHYAVEGMFNSLGPHTKTFGNICLSTGAEAVKKSFGDLVSPVPEDMTKSKLIVIWGANPAVTNIHQMKFIYEARKNGAQLIVIDPVYTDTAAKADIYIQINPGTDALLALAIAKIILTRKSSRPIREQFHGWEEYKKLLLELDLDMVIGETGVTHEVIEALATYYCTIKPIATWNGIGIQRNRFGGQSIKAINSLVALSGNLNIENGGVYFTHGDIEDFPLALQNLPEKKHKTIEESRLINSSNFALEALSLDDPPLKFLWIAARNPLSQDHHLKAWQELINQLELIVTVDLYMTDTAKQSDLVLPAASHYEEEDLNVGYWHHWLSLNQKTIPPYYEAKSDLMIARELTKKLNELTPGFSEFPSELEPLDWIEKELADEKIKSLYGIDSYKDLLKGPLHRKKLPIEKESFSFIQKEDLAEMLIHFIHTKKRKHHAYPFRLLSPQSLLKIHSQFVSLPWLNPHHEESIVEMNAQKANSMGIEDGAVVQVFNELGSIQARAITNEHLPLDVVIVKQTAQNSINKLIGSQVPKGDDLSSTYFYDSYVNIKSISK